MSNPDPLYTLRGTESPVTYLKFQGSSTEYLYTGCEEGIVHIWNMHTRRIENSLNAHADRSVLWIDFVDDQLVTQGRDGLVKFWSPAESKWTLSGHLKSGQLVFCPSSLVTAGNSTLLVLPSETTSQVDIFDSKTYNCVGNLQPSKDQSKYGMCMRIKSVKDEKGLLIGYESGHIALWDMRNFKMVDSIKCHQESLMCMGYSLELNKGISGSVDNKILSWKLTKETFSDTSESKSVQHFDILESVEVTNAGFNDVVIRNDSRICATAGWDSNIRVFSMKNLKPLAVLSYHKQSIQCVTFSSDNILACGSKDNYISLWDIYR